MGSDLYAPVIVGLATGIAFIVVVASAIERPLTAPNDFIGFANELDQTKAFLTEYPAASVHIYSVMCTSLTECPGPTVEYWYEDDANFASLRVQIQPSERVVTHMQAQCGDLAIMGPRIETPQLVELLDNDCSGEAPPRISPDIERRPTE